MQEGKPGVLKLANNKKLNRNLVCLIFFRVVFAPSQTYKIVNFIGLTNNSITRPSRKRKILSASINSVKIELMKQLED